MAYHKIHCVTSFLDDPFMPAVCRKLYSEYDIVSRHFSQKKFNLLFQVPLSVTRFGRLTRVASTPDSEFEIRNFYGTPDYPIKPKPENLSRAKKVNRLRPLLRIKT